MPAIETIHLKCYLGGGEKPRFPKAFTINFDGIDIAPNETLQSDINLTFSLLTCAGCVRYPNPTNILTPRHPVELTHERGHVTSCEPID